jgi:hypothetical protein
MKDREQNQFEGVLLPPAWCGAICRNAMNEICIEHCAVKRDCSAFEPKPNLKLSDMPHFPLKDTANMTKEERFTSVTVYLAKVVDHLQGNEDEGPVILARASRANISAEIAGISSSLQDLQNETVIAEANGNNSNEIYSSGNTVNKEQE